MDTEKQIKKEITNDYIRGLIDGEGCFTFSTIPRFNKQGKRIKIPTFVIAMNSRDEDLIKKVKTHMRLRESIYIHKAWKKDGYNRGDIVRLMVRDFGDLRDKVIPFFNNQLIGYKSAQFKEWMEKIGTDPDVHKDYKVLYTLYKNNYFNKAKYP